ncbi:homoserine kinase [Apilactobacillus kunkeei]|uniref:homoserine kinase n=1 Tax=Apilactobacillus kunkeei TaxID=148814 RepID=UPI002009FE0B|nr:homoserine kinase [Apilactobacillus kunkeei]MCK8625577.1 homoserine kinase [Apilactobacillus kunkeei]
MIKVIVPATSANIAMGYDCLGMAVNLFTAVKIDEADKFNITGCDEAFQNKDNLVYQGFIQGCKHLNRAVPTISIDIQSEIPESRGLGSSSACIVAGIIGAFEYFKEEVDKDVVLQIATKMEGHPDNVAPAIYGGLCMAFEDSNGHYDVIKYPVDDSYYFTAVIPDFKVSTNEARKIVPKEVKTSTVAHQLSHCLAMLNALSTGDIQHLNDAIDDRLHEPYRQKLINDFDEVKKIVEENDSVVYISGSGSTLIIISNSADRRDKIIEALQKRFEKFSIKNVEIMN